MKDFLRLIWSYRQQLTLVLAPLVFLPVVFVMPPQEGKCLYIVLIMAVYWCMETLPLAVTALLPLSLLPLFGILPSSKTCPLYFLDTNVLFFGGLVMAVAIEDCNLHRRVALAILRCLGVNPLMLTLGMMLTTALLSMWLSNTATTAMMMPIATAILKRLYGEFEAVPQSKTSDTELQKHELPTEENPDNQEAEEEGKSEVQELRTEDSPQPTEQSQLEKPSKNLAKSILISIPYAASIGGISTLTGTPPNLILDGQLKSIFPQSDELNFGSWFVFALPLSLIFLVLAWLWITFLYGGLRLRSLIKRKSTESEIKAKAVIHSEFAQLGPMTFAEGAVSGFFTAFVILLLTRHPKFIPGWAKLFKPKYVTDAVVAMGIIILMFIFPSRKPSFKWKTNPEEPVIPNEPLLTWKKVKHNVAWNVIILLGGGFAIAKACEESGLSRWIGSKLRPLEYISASTTVLIVSLVVSAFTEFASNTATSIIFLPILAELATEAKEHPLYLMIPGTVSCSFAFMLPVATPPNAIAFTTGHLKVKDMMKTGLLMNIMGIILVNVAINTWGRLIFKFSTFPEWAMESENSTDRAVTIFQLYTVNAVD
ncbi:Na(+)/dicarboxylate cotransporter 3-like [Hemiscyllium ocellatum]|uniref:Na(+)/dicarboxylate cotransporter 3-like n=1 Tax=Hemiscyllium ocellatum TaxID=170820 RepID=UPI002966139A|nr:Na(+)/dicarboxylate cotransporter 3-like [Hemiscyllium ocellatum]